MRASFAEETRRLYALINETAGEGLRVLEDNMDTVMRAQTGDGIPEADVRAALTRLEQTGSEIRKTVTELLTSDAVRGFDDDLVHDAKRHIHTDLGRVLTMTNWLRGEKYGEGFFGTLPGDESQKDRPRVSHGPALIKEWEDVLTGIRTGAWKAAQTDAKKQLKDAAKAAGVSLVFTETLPDDEAALRMFIRNASAKIVAAVRAGEERVTLP